MKAINLRDFYKIIEKGSLSEKVYIKNPYIDGGSFEIIETLGAGHLSYHFLASDKGEVVALRVSYEKVDFHKISTVKKLKRDEYRKYLLHHFGQSQPIEYLYKGKEKLFFDKEVFVSTWEPADATLSEKLKESFDNKLKWFSHLLKGLSVIHERERLHLDIKLDNLFIVGGQLKIGDFEFYLKKEDFLRDGPRICGTPGHIAPEMFLDRENVSEKCDIFSAGVTFCELFTESKLPGDLLKTGTVLSTDEQEEFNGLFGDRHLAISDKKIGELFIKNFKIFNFFKHQMEKKLGGDKISQKERKIYELVLNMVEIDQKARPDVDRLLFKTHELEFDPESLIGRKLVNNRYIVQELIDDGGRGSVFKVLDDTEGVVKAIKLFPPQYSLLKKAFEQIKNELIVTRDIHHRNVVSVYGLEKEGDLNFIVMEYISGFTLKKKRESASGGKLKESEALKIMRQVASGLIEAHRNGVIHRNLKDKNIMIRTDDNMVKIINFGLSIKIKKAISEITGQDVLGSGTLLVAAPEQLAEILTEEDQQTDIWWFGTLLYQLLVGETPFDKNDSVRDPKTLPPITGISEKARAVIMKCLEKDRLRRYRNMDEVYNDLFGEGEISNIYLVKHDGSDRPGFIKTILKFFQNFKGKSKNL